MLALVEEAQSPPAPEARGAGATVTAIAVRLFSIMARRRGLLALSIACGTLSALLSLGPYLAVAATIVELLAAEPDSRLILRLGLLGAAAAVADKIFFGLATALSHAVAFRTQRDLRFEMARKLERVPLSYMDGKSKGQVRSVLVDDIETLEDAMAHLVPETSAAVIAPAVALIAMVAIDWRLTLLLLVPILVGARLFARLINGGDGATRDYFSLLDRLATTSAELADGLPTVRAFNQDGQATARARGVFAEVTAFTNRWVQRAVVPGTTAQVLLSSHLFLAGPAGLLMAAAGAISIGELAAFAALAYGLGDLFNALQGISHRVMTQAQILERIDGLLSTPEVPAPTTPCAPRDSGIVVDDVGFAYGDRAVLRGIDLNIAPGGFLALVGPSGSGKSTLARLIARFADVGHGAIRIGGVDVRCIDPSELNRAVAFIFQDVFLFEGTIADNIRLGKPAATDDEVAAAATVAQAHDFIMRLPDGYATKVGERGYGLSGGERQRISIARSVLKDAPILILDEATAYADPENEALVQDAIAGLARQRTLIVIAHRLNTITAADEIAVIDDGRVSERGTHSTLVAAGGTYARMWQAQQDASSYRHQSGAIA